MGLSQRFEPIDRIHRGTGLIWTLCEPKGEGRPRTDPLSGPPGYRTRRTRTVDVLQRKTVQMRNFSYVALQKPLFDPSPSGDIPTT